MGNRESYSICFERSKFDMGDTFRYSCVVSTWRPSLSQVMLGAGMPLATHWRLMGRWRTTERSTWPVERMDGGTGGERESHQERGEEIMN